MKFDIRNMAETSADIFFYGDILSNEAEQFSYDDVVPSTVIQQLAELKGKDINIHISSYGGSVFGGLSIFNSLMALDCKKTVYIDSCACSIASVIAMAGDKIVMPSNSMLMIHSAFCGCVANADEMRKQAEVLDKIDAQILEIYKTRLRDDYAVEDLVALIKAESWLSAKECAEIFNNIELEEEKCVAFAKANESDFFNNYKNVPFELLNELQEDEEIPQETDEEVCEECGKNPCECEGQQEDAQVENKEKEIIDEVVEEDDKKEEPQEDEEIQNVEKVGELEFEEDKKNAVEEDEEIQDVEEQEIEIVKRKPLDEEEDEIKDVEEQEIDIIEEDEEEQEVCEECGKNPCECKKEEEDKQVQIAQAKKELDFLNAKAFLEKYL